MKLYYLIYGNYFLQNTGVGIKILAKAKALNELGMPTTILAFSDCAQKEAQPNEYTQVIPIARNNSEAFTTIKKHLKEIDAPGNRYLMRYPFASKGLLALFQEFPGKIYLEHNTFEKEEYLLTQRNHFQKLTFSFSPSYIKYFSQTYISKHSPEKKYGDQVLRHAKGGICVTNEIAAYEKKRYADYHTYVISNGAEEKSKGPNPAPQLTDTLRIFMLIGGFSTWHGVDRILNGLKNYKRKDLKIQFDFFGLENYDPKIERETENYSVHFHPTLSDSKIQDKVNGYHLSFSSLALHRIKLKEASPLKLRTCMLMGYPTVLGYNDTDVTNNERFKPYTLQVPANESPIDLTKVCAFYEDVKKIDSYPEKIAKLSSSVFSYKVKAKQLIDIINKG